MQNTYILALLNTLIFGHTDYMSLIFMEQSYACRGLQRDGCSSGKGEQEMCCHTPLSGNSRQQKMGFLSSAARPLVKF